MCNFSHNMHKEIFQQPDSIRCTLNDNLNRIKIFFKRSSSIERIYFVGSGTSYHASLVGQLLISKLTRLPATAIPSSEFTSWTPNYFDKGTLIIAVSQSGESIDTVGAAKTGKNRGAVLLAITNNPRSSLNRIADYSLTTRAGEEKAVTATKSYTTQLTVIYLISLELAERLKENREIVEKGRSSLNNLPSILDSEIVKVDKKAAEIADKYKSFKFFFLLGSDLNYPTALEGALKLKEACNLYAEGFASREFLHGPVQLVNEETGIIIVSTNGWDQRLTNLSNDLKNYGAPVIAIAGLEERSIVEVTDWMPSLQVHSLLTPIVYVIPLQIFAYYSSIIRGLNPDKPEKLSKVVEE